MSEALSLFVGGTIRPVSSMQCTGSSDLDFSHAGNQVLLATCTINNNLASYQALFRFEWRDSFSGTDGTDLPFTSVTLQETGGLLGQGITPLNGVEILSQIKGNSYTWNPEEQKTSTINYTVEIRASWTALNPTPNDETIHLTTQLVSAF